MFNYLTKFLAVQIEWSSKTFGPGRRTKGICDHIRKELEEIEQDPKDWKEWIDVLILGLDGFWRALFVELMENRPSVPDYEVGAPTDHLDYLVQSLESALGAKQSKNLARAWAPPPLETEASLHVRDKVYIAAAYSNKDQACRVRAIIGAIGYACTSTWLDSIHGDAVSLLNSGKATLEQVQAWARQDLADIDAADILLLLTQDPTTPMVRGGRMTELGYAMGKGKTIWIIGPRENIFTSLADKDWTSPVAMTQDAKLSWPLFSNRNPKLSAILGVLPDAVSRAINIDPDPNPNPDENLQGQRAGEEGALGELPK
jgi:hypothetical protein